MMTLAALGFAAGAALLQLQPALPALGWTALIIPVGALAIRYRALVIPLAAANVLVGCVWFIGLRRLQTLGIRHQSSRLIFQAILHPLAILGPAGVVIDAFLLVATVVGAIATRTFEGYALIPASFVAVLFWSAISLATRRWFLRLLAAERSRNGPD